MPVFNNILAGAAGSGGAAGYKIERSLRFNDGDSSNLVKNFSSTGNQQTWTISMWVKRGALGIADTYLFESTNTTPELTGAYFDSSDKLYFRGYTNTFTWRLQTTRVFRDPSAWYHLVFVFDSTNSTSGDRVRLYVNGTRETTFDAELYPSQNHSSGWNYTGNKYIGSYFNPSNYFDGYLAEIHSVDGLTPGTNTDDTNGSVTGTPNAKYLTDFGEFDADTGVWNPKAFSGTYGTNGFYLDFSDNSSNAALGFNALVAGNRYSAYVSGPINSNSSAANLFDGSTSTYMLGTNGTSQTWQPVPGIAWTDYAGGVEVYFHNTSSVDKVRINGGSWVVQQNSTGGWEKVSTGDGTLTKMEFSDNAGQETAIYAIRINGTILTDVANTNDWQVNNIIATPLVGTTSYDNGTYLKNLAWTNTAGNYPLLGTYAWNVKSFNGNTSNSMQVSTGGGTTTITWTPDNAISLSTFRFHMGNSWHIGGNTYEVSYNINGTGWTVLGSTSTSNAVGAPFRWNSVSVPNNSLTSFAVKTSTTSSGWGSGAWNALEIDGTILVENGLGQDIDSLLDSPTNYEASSGNNGGNYATMNPLVQAYRSQYAGNFALSNGNLDLDLSSGEGASTSTIAVPTTGKYYFEVLCNTQGSDQNIFLVDRVEPYASSSSTLQVVFRNLSAGATLGIAVNRDTGVVTKYVNGSSSGTFTAAAVPYHLYVYDYQSGSYSVNFGQRPFAYTPPTGFKSLCTQNFDDPLIANPSTAMDVITYTGTDTTRTFTGFNMSPDLVWFKSRSTSYDHILFDIVRGATKRLKPNSTGAEDTNSTGLTAFTSDGFTVGGADSVNGPSDKTYVAWAWDAGTSTVSNTDGSITSSVRANQTAGFSIVTYTDPTSGNVQTVGHGLNAAPEFIIVKSRTGTTVWLTYHKSLGKDYYTRLEDTDASYNVSNIWGSAEPTSSVFGVKGDNQSNMVAYCWTSVEGYSAFGSYTGNGSADGPFVFTGMRPKWLLLKRTDSTKSWQIIDTERSAHNVTDDRLFPDDSGAESSSSNFNLDILSNGFKCRTAHDSTNVSGGTYIYAAFAENPFKTARAR